MPRLENWSIVPAGDENRLTGNIYGHTGIEDGRRAITTPLVAGPVLLGSGLVARTKTGTVYELPVRCCTDIPIESCDRFGPECEGCPASGMRFTVGE